MKRYIRLKLLLGSMGLIFVIKLIFRQRTMTPEREGIHKDLLKDLRTQLISEMCDSDNDTFSEVKHTFEEIRSSTLRHLIVDDKQGIIYCYIPLVIDVIITNWIALENHSELKLLNSESRIKMEAKLKEYTKFLFVQDPFVRLISVYREAFLQEDDYYYRNFGLPIMYRYSHYSNPPQTAEEAFAADVRPSFRNFIQYLTDPETITPFEPLWRPMYQLCHPCLIGYDFVGHLETSQEDVEQLLDILKQDSRFPRAYHGTAPPDSVADWFRVVSAEEGRKLYKLYEMDFRFFGYPEPVEWLGG